MTSLVPPTAACTRWAARSTDQVLSWTPFRPFLCVFRGSLQFVCRYVRFTSVRRRLPQMWLSSPELTKRPQKAQTALLSKGACNCLPAARSLWFDWIETGGREAETSVGDPPWKLVCVELSAFKRRISGCDLLNKSMSADKLLLWVIKAPKTNYLKYKLHIWYWGQRKHFLPFTF